MTAVPLGPNAWVQLLQAMAAREGIEQLGISSRKMAELLGVAPSAVSQYLSGKRQARSPLSLTLASHEGARAIARRTAERLLEPSSGPAARTRIVLEGAGDLSELSMNPHAKGYGPSSPLRSSGDRASRELRAPLELSRWLRVRVRAEQVAVAQSMRLAQKARDELTRAILRQIASDSLRHAEIVASLGPYVERGRLETHASGITPKDVRDLIESEERAESEIGPGLRGRVKGTMALLLASMEADERKHAELLRGLLERAFEPPTRAPSPPSTGGRSNAQGEAAPS